MKITNKALRRVRRLKSIQGRSRATGLRIGLRDREAYLVWDLGGPQAGDLVLGTRDIPVLIDAGDYMALSDYVLDFGDDRGIDKFLLRRGSQAQSASLDIDARNTTDGRK